MAFAKKRMTGSSPIFMTSESSTLPAQRGGKTLHTEDLYVNRLIVTDPLTLICRSVRPHTNAAPSSMPTRISLRKLYSRRPRADPHQRPGQTPRIFHGRLAALGSIRKRCWFLPRRHAAGAHVPGKASINDACLDSALANLLNDHAAH